MCCVYLPCMVAYRPHVVMQLFQVSAVRGVDLVMLYVLPYHMRVDMLCLDTVMFMLSG
jgi:hypothetical protein